MAAMAAIDAKFEYALQTLVPINGLSQQRRQQLMAQASVLEFGRNEFIFREGDRDEFAFYLLDGQLELLAQKQLVKRITGGSDDASHPLARLQPRQLSARAKTAVTVLRVDRNLLDKLLAIDGTTEEQKVTVSEIETDEDGDWMTKMLQSELFSRVPAANIQRIFTKLESINFSAGEVVVKQDEPGDFYYIIQQGRCEVTRRGANAKAAIKLAELVSGDSFGEEALVSESQRNASVRMITDGTLMRLTKEDFIELIRTPLLSEIDFEEGKRLAEEQNALWVDVRFPEEHHNGAIANSQNQPLNTLRMHAERLDRDKTYIVYCDTGSRSSAAAFIMSERGFDVHCLRGGLLEYGILSSNEQRFSDELGESPDEADLTIHDGDEETQITVAALVPASHREEADSPPSSRTVDSEEVMAADRRAQALKAELAKANIKLEEARRLKEQAEKAKQEAKKVVSEELALERQRIAEQEQKAKLAFQEAEKLKQELAKAKELAKADSEHLKEAGLAEAERLRIELEEAKRNAEQQAELTKQREQQWAAERQQELEEARQRAAEAEELKQRELEDAERLKRELEEAKQQALAEAQEIKQRELEEAERLKRELEQARQEAQAEAERLKRLETEELEKANQILEQARLEKERAEAARIEMERAAEEKIKAEQEKLALQAQRAQESIEEATRLREELAAERQRAQNEAEQKRIQQEQQLEEMQRLAEERLREKEQELESRYASQAQELEELQRKKEQAEEELERQRHEIVAEASEAKKRLSEAKRIQSEVEQAREESAREAELREARQRELETKLKSDLREQLDSERHKLEAEFARNAEELERARREKEAAEAARLAAAEEAERIIEDYKSTHEELRQREQEKLRVERERLETEASRLRETLAEAKAASDRAQEAAKEAEKEIYRLSYAQQQADPNSTLANRIVVDIAELEAEVNAAKAEATAAEEAKRQVEAAAQANTQHLVQHRREETESRNRFEEEIEGWYAIPKDIAQKAKMMFLNSPNNPTSVVASKEFFKKTVEFAKEHQIIVCHDAAYSEIYYDGKRPCSFLEAEGAMDVGVEFHSLSKTFNMTGWRIGFAVGRQEVIAGLGKVKTNIDSGVFQAIQEAGMTALELDDSVTNDLRGIYQERRDVLVSGLKNLGLSLETPEAAFYVWIEVPKGYTAASFTAHLIEKAGIVTTPGNGFGDPGEGYIRMTVTTTKERLAEAVERMQKIGW